MNTHTEHIYCICILIIYSVCCHSTPLGLVCMFEKQQKKTCHKKACLQATNCQHGFITAALATCKKVESLRRRSTASVSRHGASCCPPSTPPPLHPTLSLPYGPSISDTAAPGSQDPDTQNSFGDCPLAAGIS